MNYARQTPRTLHEEHLASITVLGRIEQVLLRAPARGALADVLLEELRPLIRQIEQDVNRHFTFEETELFTRMGEAGEGDIAGLLAEEHEAIRAVAEDLLPLLRRAIERTLDGDGWDTLRRDALELVERQVSHIQKEQMALLPMLDDLLDEETDGRLALAYASA